MRPTMHACRGEEDYRRIREFLRQVFLLNGRRDRSWHLNRFDYWRWHGLENLEHRRLEDTVFLWETSDGRIAGLVNPEGMHDVFLQVHPGLRTAELEEEMVAVAEERFVVPREDGTRVSRVWADADDGVRRGVLERRGYAKVDGAEHRRWRSLDPPIADARPLGYTIRALGGEEELPARSTASWRAFHPDVPDDRHGGWEWYRNIERAPLYRRDLDLVAVAPAGEIAAFCTAWFDEPTATGVFEPVATVLAHRRRGLARSVLCAALRRLKGLGATLALVGSSAPEAHALYASVEFTDYVVSEPWERRVRDPCHHERRPA